MEIHIGTESVNLNNVIAALPTTGGKIKLPAGKLIVPEPIRITKSFSIEGAGMKTGTIRDGNVDGITTLSLANGVNDSVFEKYPLNDDTPNTHWHVEIKDLCIDGNRQNQTAGHGIVCDYLDIECRNVVVRNCKGNGWHAGADYAKNEIYLSHCKGIRNTGYGAYLKAQGCRVESLCYFGGNELDGLWVGGGSGDTWLEAEVEGNYRYGFQANSIGTSYLNIWAAGNSEAGIFLNGVWGSHGKLFAKWNALTGAIQPCEIAFYHVRDSNFQVSAHPYAINRRGITFGHSQRRNTLVINSTVNENLNPMTGTVGLHFANWGSLDLSGTRFWGVVRAATPYQFDGIPEPAGLDMTSFLRDVTLITG